MITRLYAHNFRCFENFTLDLSDTPSALLIGRNGSGKSTVRHLLGLFQKIGRGPNRARDLVTVADYNVGGGYAPLRVEIELRLHAIPCKYAVSFGWTPDMEEAYVRDERLEVGGALLFERNINNVQLGSGVAFGLDSQVLALPVIQEHPGKVGVREVREFFSSLFLISPVPCLMTGHSLEPTDELLADGSNLASCLQSMLTRKPAAYSPFVEYVQQVFQDFESIENRRVGEKGTELLVKYGRQEPRRELTLEFKQLSDGEKCVFLAAFVVTMSKVSAPVFCFWDEPDNHLSLDEASQFIMSLRKLAVRENQLVVTSHHPEAIRTFSDETTVVFTRNSRLDPVVPKRLSEIGYRGDLIDALILGEVLGTP
jgi:predicted ATPase